MRLFLTQKRVFFPTLAAILIFCLIAPQFIQACGCACDYGKNAKKPVKAENVRVSTVAPLPDACCTNGCSEKSSGHDLNNDIGVDSSGGSNPICCCETDSGQKTLVAPVIPTDAPRSQFTELRYQQAGLSASLPDLHYINNGSLPDFCRDITPTSPHIASTVLLI